MDAPPPSFAVAPTTEAAPPGPRIGTPTNAHPPPTPVPTTPTPETAGAGSEAQQAGGTVAEISANPANDIETEDGRIRNMEAAKNIKDAWIYRQIQARQDEFTNYKQARLFLGTYNVNAKGKEDTELEDWLCHDWGPNGETAPDVVVVGFQEIVDLNAVNVTMGDGKSQQRAHFWIERIRLTLNSKRYTHGDPKRAYSFLSHKVMVGLLITVFVKNPHKLRVRHVATASVGVGVMGVMGNKGGVAVRLQFYDSTVCCVCTHLAAHRENVAGRNADYSNIYHKLTFDLGEEAAREAIRGGTYVTSHSVGIPDHDLVFWIGDLNYRVDEEIETEEAMAMATTGPSKIAELLAHDQLTQERKDGRVFQGFEEGKIEFAPTYKYQPLTDQYEQRPDKKLRAPAWTDRILWRTTPDVKQLCYTRSEINISDHKPVMSTMLVTVKDVMQNVREEIAQEVNALLDKYENQSLPMVGLDRIRLDFGHLRYDQTVTLPIRVTNTGKVLAQFRLVPKLQEKTLCKPWMTVSPTYGMLIPGEKPATLHFSITIDNVTARKLSSGHEVLEDIIILRLENGRDYYITVTGKYARSCFGMSVDELVMFADPIRTVPLDPIAKADVLDLHPSAALCIPKELWRIVDALYHTGLDVEDLFAVAGDPAEVYALRECLDTGIPFPPIGGNKRNSHDDGGSSAGGSTTSSGNQAHNQTVHSMAEVLLSFLSNLSVPIVPDELFEKTGLHALGEGSGSGGGALDAHNIPSGARKFLEELPPIHYNVFVYIISFFRECLAHKDRNGLTAAKLARVCSNCLVTVGSSRRSSVQLIMQHFLGTPII